MKNDSNCYDIENKIFNFRQGTLSITKYYGILNELWIELDQYQGLKMCKANSIAFIELIERGRIFKFLLGLNSEYDPIWVQILGKEKFFNHAISNENHIKAIQELRDCPHYLYTPAFTYNRTYLPHILYAKNNDDLMQFLDDVNTLTSPPYRFAWVN
ncbi:hypothetical protein CR513_60473, partial [Mucuna pruriens]